jgi:hypothetical protein
VLVPDILIQPEFLDDDDIADLVVQLRTIGYDAEPEQRERRAIGGPWWDLALSWIAGYAFNGTLDALKEWAKARWRDRHPDKAPPRTIVLYGPDDEVLSVVEVEAPKDE